MTEEKKVLLASEMASYSDFFQRLLDPTFLLDYDSFAIREVNDSCEKVFGVTPVQFLGTQLTQWIEKDYVVACEKALRMARRKYYPFQIDLRMTASEGRVLVIQAAACALVLTDGSQVIQIVAKDITKQHEAEQKANQYFEELKHANEKLAAQSITDEMTQLSNFRHFKSELLAQHERSVRFSTPYAIIFLDLDNFKHYNDTHGHPAGDEILKGIAKILRSSSRNTDLPARYGGEEFVILCAGVDGQQALTLAERVRQTIASTPFPYAAQQPLGLVSASIGVASFPDHANSPEETLKQADEALYVSKHSGRNRITLSTHVNETVHPAEAAQAKTESGKKAKSKA